MKCIEKRWFWWLTFPFMHRSYTVIRDRFYYPRGAYPNHANLGHGAIHHVQQSAMGSVRYWFLYLFCLPLFYNKWRYRWEREAFQWGSKLSLDETQQLLRSYRFGWLLHKKI